MQTAQPKIDISVRRQRLVLKQGRKTVRTYPISTSRFGIGSDQGSFKTPLGRFRIAEKIGHGAAPGTIFIWLDGLEKENANTRDRFIYIHGTKHEDRIGTPDSHGCIRMRNADVIELFDLVDEGTPVVIHA